MGVGWNGPWATAALAGVLTAVNSCSGINPDAIPPSEVRPPIDNPANHRIHFRDGEVRHVVTLHDDGSYLFKSGTDFAGVESARDGRWTWKKSGTHQAQLTLDADVWNLRFVGYDSAFAVNEAAPAKSFVFEFEGM